MGLGRLLAAPQDPESREPGHQAQARHHAVDDVEVAELGLAVAREKGEEEASQGRTQEVADDGDRGKPGEHFGPAGRGQVGHHGHSHRSIDGGGEAVKKADHHQGRVRVHEKIGEGHQGEAGQAEEQGAGLADDVGEDAGGHLEEDAGDGGDGHGKTDGFGTGPQKGGKQGQNRGAGQGVGQTGEKAHQAKAGQGGGGVRRGEGRGRVHDLEISSLNVAQVWPGGQ